MKKILEKEWPLLLFEKSVLKQRKFQEITALLGESTELHCLDIGSDNGVISYLLRQRGGIWKSADLDEHTVDSIRGLVKDNVFQIDGRQTPFADNEFDRVAIIDFLEHIHTDEEFVKELFRIIKPGGELIINVPHIKNSLLRRFRLAIGQTDEKHGHVRPGYTVDDLVSLLMGRFKIVSHRTYSKFFSEAIDTLMTLALDVLKRGGAKSQKGRIVTGQDMKRYQKMFRMYSLVYPVVWLFSKLDGLLLGVSGYMLIVKARIDKA
ncbi:MAG: class I SAM-dependent methyltransferase [Coleofasciculus sp. B1-GNL1-01]|uniref:methyltransferase domain-containing protein n=1 Tax=Coleofasciculus sp. B1-GNL1-01 TaxID=3068484 RepID=UPI0032F780C6